MSAGLGFDDCSAKAIDIPDRAFAGSGMIVFEHQEIEAKAWDYYRFNVTENDYQIIANIAGEDSEDDECELQTGMSNHLLIAKECLMPFCMALKSQTESFD